VKLWALAGVTLAVYLLGLAVSAPATLIDAQLRQASAGRLRLAEASGTLWAGAGQLELRDASRRTGVARHVAWRARPANPLAGPLLHYDVFLDHAAKPFPVALRLRQVELTQAVIRLPAAALALAEPKLAPLELTGDLVLRVERLALARGAARGDAVLQWHGAASALTRVSPLGDYEMRIDSDGAVVRAALRTLRGPLQLEGSGSWTSGRNPELQVIARIPPPQQQQLSPLLRLIAVDRGGGVFALQLR
jgi:general secretion pathway protein N